MRSTPVPILEIGQLIVERCLCVLLGHRRQGGLGARGVDRARDPFVRDEAGNRTVFEGSPAYKRVVAASPTGAVVMATASNPEGYNNNDTQQGMCCVRMWQVVTLVLLMGSTTWKGPCSYK